MSAALVPGVGGKKCAVDGEYFMREEPQKVYDLNQDVKDLLVAIFSQSAFEVGKGCLTGEMGMANPCVKSVVSALIPIPQYVQEGFYIGELLEVAKELQKKETHGVIGNTGNTISVCHQRADKGEINQRGNKTGEAAGYAAPLFYPDIAMFEAVLGKPEGFGFEEGPEMFLENADTDAVEFAHDLAETEGSKISQRRSAWCLW
jgi:hypothetical protein